MRYTGPRNRLSRREGIDLNLKTLGSNAQASLMRRMNIRPGQRPNTRYSKMTEYGAQLREKQKIRRMYGITESQLSKYFAESNKAKGNTSTLMVEHLELRLDNVVYRMGFAPTRAAARQLVNHGHFQLNKKKATIPSQHVKIDDVITLKSAKTASIPYVKELLDQKNANLPAWLERKATVGKVVDKPGVESLGEEINLQAVIEFYSR